MICTPGGSGGALSALDANTGKVLWLPKEFTEPAQYSSPIVITQRGKRQYVQLVMKKLVGVDARSGKLIWESDWPGKVAVIPTPIYADDHVYISSGYGIGCKLVELTSSGARDVYDNKIMKNHHGGVIKLGNYLYGYSDGYGWVCQDFKSGELLWNEKRLLAKGQSHMQMTASTVWVKEMVVSFLSKQLLKVGDLKENSPLIRRLKKGIPKAKSGLIRS